MASLVASLVTELTVNLAKWRSEMGQAAKISDTRLREIQRSADQTVKGMEKAGRGISSALGAIGIGVSAGALIASLKQAATAAIQYGDEVEKAAKKTGLSSSQFAQLADAAKLADVDMQTLSKGLRSMQVNISELASKGAKGPEVFKALGLSIKDLQSLDADKQLELIADRIASLKEPADRTRAGVDLFGKAWDALAPALLDGADGLKAAREEIARLGGSLTDDQIKKLADADQSIKQLDASWSRFARTLTASVAPALSSVLDGLIGIKPDQIETSLAFALSKLAELRKQQATYSQPGFDKRVLDDINRQIDETLKKVGELRTQLAQVGQKPSGPMYRKNFPTEETGPGYTPSGDKSKSGSDLYAPYVDPRRMFDFIGSQDNALKELSQTVTKQFDEDFAHITDSSQEMFDNVTEGWSKLYGEGEETFSAWTAFADEAARNIQDSLANFLFDPFAEGLNGMLSGFVDVIRRMVAEIAAQAILTQFFGWMSGLGGGLGSFGSAALKSITGRAAGGPVTAGTPYWVGESGKPELFVPSTSGTIIPSGAGGAISLTYNIDARGADAARIMAILPGMLKQTKDATVAEVLRLNRQGRFA